jgi:Tripartite tricarboxylate transporter TctB family
LQGSTEPSPGTPPSAGWLDFGGGLFVLAWGIAGLFGLLSRPGLWRDDYGLDPGPALLPGLVVGSLLAGGLALVVKGSVAVMQSRTGSLREIIAIESRPAVIAGLLLASVIAYALAMRQIGFAWATPVFAAVWIAVISRRDGSAGAIQTAVRAVLGGVALTASVLFVFQRLIGVLLP